MVEQKKGSIENDFLFKPQNSFTSNALRNCAPAANNKKKLATISQRVSQMMNSKQSQKLFGKLESTQHNTLNMEKQNFCPRNIKINSLNVKIGNTKENQELADRLFKQMKLEEEIEENSSSDSSSESHHESSDDLAKSDSESSDSEKSGDAKDDSEEKLYQQLLEQQQNQQDHKEDQKEKLENLVDQSLMDLLTACSLLEMPKADEIKRKSVKFGPKTRQKLLILDMDETLLHSKFSPYYMCKDTGEFNGLQSVNGVAQFNILLKGVEGESQTVKLNVKLRQHVEDVLQYLSTLYEICVFTAGEQIYADTVLDFIDQDRSVIKFRLYRQHCINPAPGVYVKELSIISDRDLKDLVIVDNSIVSFAYNLSNGIPIASFTGQQKDEELLFMVSFLEELYSVVDVRPRIDETFQLKQRQKEALKNSVVDKETLMKGAIANQTQNNALQYQ